MKYIDLLSVELQWGWGREGEGSCKALQFHTSIELWPNDVTSRCFIKLEENGQENEKNNFGKLSAQSGIKIWIG